MFIIIQFKPPLLYFKYKIRKPPKMKTLISYTLPKILSIFIMTVLITFGVQAAPELNVGTVSGKVGDIVELPITFINDGTVTGLQFDIVLPDGFTVVAPGVKRGPAIPSSNEDIFHTLIKSISEKSIRVIVVDFQSAPPTPIPSDGNKGLVLVKALVLIGEDAVGENIVSLTDIVLGDSESKNVQPTSITSGSITVTDGNTSTDVNLPNVIGQSKSVAKSTLENLGLTISIISEHNDTVPVGHVITQMPTASEMVSAGSSVILLISNGSTVTSTKVELNVGEVIGKVGDVVKLPITFINNGTVKNIQFNVMLPTGFTPVPPLAERGPAIPLGGDNLQSLATRENDNSVLVAIRGDYPYKPIRSDGKNGLVLVNIVVRIDKEATGKNIVSLNHIDLGDGNSEVALTSTTIGSISVIGKSGFVEITMPDLGIASLSKTSAISFLNNLGFLRVTTTPVYSETYTKGFVIGQVPASGEVVSIESTVELIVSQGSINDLDAGVPSEPIPTLSFWGLLGLSALMPGVVVWMSKKKKIK